MAKPELAMVQKRNDAKQLVKQHILKRPAAVQNAAKSSLGVFDEIAGAGDMLPAKERI